MAEKILPVCQNEEICLQIIGITHHGEGVGRCRGLAVFVPGAAPGEKVRARVVELKNSYARARLLEISTPSPARREPRCSLFRDCGGCRLQHIDYQEQVRLKTGLVRDSLARIAGLESVPVLDTAGMENPWHYRNKAQFQVEAGPEGLALGFYREGTHELTPCFTAGGAKKQGCLLVDQDINAAAALVETLINRRGPAGFRGQGHFFRRVVVRKAFATGQMMVILVTGPGDWPEENKFAGELISRQPQITSLVRSVSPGPQGRAPAGENRLLAGRDHITDRMDHLSFIISPSSFYQVNPAQTQVLYRKALEYAGLEDKPGSTVVDAYSGIGTIALLAAGRAKKVYGLEEVPGAVEDSRRNAGLNGINNVEFILGRVEKILPGMAARGARPDVVVLDPPRGGCRPEVLEAVAAMGTPRMVYVSCDPGTLARDLGRLSKMGYRTEEVQPVDMFPWTHHMECAVKISRG